MKKSPKSSVPLLWLISSVNHFPKLFSSEYSCLLKWLTPEDLISNKLFFDKKQQLNSLSSGGIEVCTNTSRPTVRDHCNSKSCKGKYFGGNCLFMPPPHASIVSYFFSKWFEIWRYSTMIEKILNLAPLKCLEMLPKRPDMWKLSD